LFPDRPEKKFKMERVKELGTLLHWTSHSKIESGNKKKHGFTNKKVGERGFRLGKKRNTSTMEKGGNNGLKKRVCSKGLKSVARKKNAKKKKRYRRTEIKRPTDRGLKSE